MNLFKKLLGGVTALYLALCFIGPMPVFAASTPSLGAASTFSVLANIYTNNTIAYGSALYGDLGYTTLSGYAYVGGATHVNDATYIQARTDQHAALSALNSQPCTVPFTGAVDLATDTTHGALGVYTPGVYCSTGAMSIGGGATITLDGAGTYIFRSSGTLTTSDFSQVNVTNGASACDVFWTPQWPTPSVSTALGLDTKFVGTVIEPVGAANSNITVGGGTKWVGRALAADWSITTNPIILKYVSITAPTCGVPPVPTTATLHVIKTFYNDYGGTAVSSNAIVHVKNGAGDVAGSPQAGAGTPGTSYTLNADTYTVSENAYAGYTPTFSGDCDTAGHVTLNSGDNKTCTIANDQNPPVPTTATLHVIKHVVNNNGGTALASSFNLHVKGATGGGMADVAGSPVAGAETPGTSYILATGTYAVSEDANSGYTSSFSGDCDSSGNITLASNDNKTCTITNDDITPVVNPGTLHVIKHVINNNGGTAVASSFNLHVKGSGSMGGVTDVSGSPAAGVETPGTSYSLLAGAYVVSEDSNSSYTSSFSGDCDLNGNVTLASGDNKTCTITNDDIDNTHTNTSESATLHVIKVVINDNGGTAIASDAVIHVMNSMGEVAGSPHAGAGTPGTPYNLTPGTYTVSENFFAGYTVAVSGDCAVNGDVVLANGDNKTCTITNNDILLPPPPTIITTPTPVVPVTCDLCARLTYDVYIINPNLTERHTGTPWVRVTDLGNNVKRYSFEDATIDPHNPLYDYNDAVIDVDFKDCKSVKFMFVSSDASWKHQIKIKVMIDGVVQSDTLVAVDSKAVVGTTKTINATTGVNTQTACLTAPAALKGKILLQVQQHGEAWYVRPSSGLRYYMKDGPVAYGMMRNFGLGITDKDLALIPSVQTIDELKNSVSVCSTNAVARRVKGNILLQVQQHGEAWYVDTTKCRRIYMKDGAAAYSLMRFLGLGITDADLAKLPIGQ